MQRLRIEFNIQTTGGDPATQDEMVDTFNMIFRVAKELLGKHPEVTDVAAFMANITLPYDE